MGTVSIRELVKLERQVTHLQCFHLQWWDRHRITDTDIPVSKGGEMECKKKSLINKSFEVQLDKC